MKNLVKFFGDPQPSRKAAKVPLLIIALTAIIGFTMVACGGGGGGKLSGTYKADQASITYVFSGKKITMLTGGYEMDGTFSTKGDEITISWNGTGKSQTDKYSLEGDKLTITNEYESMTYTKQK